MAGKKIMNKKTLDKNSVGKPRAYKDTKKDIELFEKICNDYIDDCIKKEVYPTIGMLCLRLGISDETLKNYMKNKKYFGAITHVRKQIDQLKLHNAYNNPNVNDRIVQMDLNANLNLYSALEYAKIEETKVNKERLELDKQKFERDKEMGVSEVVTINRVIDINIEEIELDENDK